jgi:hypothetical protein
MTIDEFLAQYAANKAANPPAPLDPNSFDQQFQYQNALTSQNAPQQVDISNMDTPYADRLAAWKAGTAIAPSWGDKGIGATAPEAPSWMAGLLAQDPSKWPSVDSQRIPIEEAQFIWDNGPAMDSNDNMLPTKAGIALGGMPDRGTDQRPEADGGWLDRNLVPILAAALVGGATMGAGVGGAGGAGSGGGAAAGAGAGEAAGGGMLLDTGGMGLTGAGGIGSVSSLADAGIAGWGAGPGVAATGLGAGLGSHFSDAGFAAEQNALNPSLGLDADYVGSGTGTGWDAGVSNTPFDINPDYANETAKLTAQNAAEPGSLLPTNAPTVDLSGAASSGLSSLQQKIASQLLKTGISKLIGGGAGGSGGGSGASGGIFGGSGGTGYSPNELSNETPGMLATSAAPQSQQQQSSASHFLGGAQQPQFQGVGYMQVPQGQDPSQMMKLAQALQGQDQNYG